jgi:hypothetical protein
MTKDEAQRSIRTFYEAVNGWLIIHKSPANRNTKVAESCRYPKVGEPTGYARFQSSYLTITEKKYSQIHFISKPDEQRIYGRRK